MNVSFEIGCDIGWIALLMDTMQVYVSFLS